MDKTAKTSTEGPKTRQTNQQLSIWPRVIYWTLEREWGDGDELLQIAGIDRTEILNSTSVPFENMAMFVLKAVERHGDRLIIEAGKSANANCLGNHGLLLQAAPNLQTLFKTIRDAKAAFSPNSEMYFKRSASAFVFDLQFRYLNDGIGKCWLYVVLQVIADLVSRHPGAHKVQYAVTSGPKLQKTDPGVLLGDYVVKPNLFGGTTGIRITFPSDVAYIQNPFFSNPSHFAELQRLATLVRPSARNSLVAPHKLVDRINNIILLHRTSLDKSFVVDRLGYSHRTFDRLLSQENTNWRTAKAHALLRLMQVLASEGISEEAAYKQIGFANRKALDRAISHAK